jgi:hypothetical protein
MSVAREAIGQRFPLYVAHHVVEHSVVIAEGVERNDVGVTQSRGGARFEAESIAVNLGVGAIR